MKSTGKAVPREPRPKAPPRRRQALPHPRKPSRTPTHGRLPAGGLPRSASGVGPPRKARKVSNNPSGPRKRIPAESSSANRPNPPSPPSSAIGPTQREPIKSISSDGAKLPKKEPSPGGDPRKRPRPN